MRVDLKFKSWMMMLAMAGVLMACGGDDEDDSTPEETDVCVVTGKTTITVTVPASTPEDASIHIVGSFNEWNPADAAYKLNKRTDAVNAYCIAVDFAAGVEFKFARGSWETVEKDAECAEVANRVFAVPADNSLEIEIAKWVDTDEC